MQTNGRAVAAREGKTVTLEQAMEGLDRLFVTVEEHTMALCQLIEHGTTDETVDRILKSRKALLNATVWLLQIMMTALAEQDTEAAILRNALEKVAEADRPVPKFSV